jgi:hypothetical protein
MDFKKYRMIITYRIPVAIPSPHKMKKIYRLNEESPLKKRGIITSHTRTLTSVKHVILKLNTISEENFMGKKPFLPANVRRSCWFIILTIVPTGGIFNIKREEAAVFQSSALAGEGGRPA